MLQLSPKDVEFDTTHKTIVFQSTAAGRRQGPSAWKADLLPLSYSRFPIILRPSLFERQAQVKTDFIELAAQIHGESDRVVIMQVSERMSITNIPLSSKSMILCMLQGSISASLTEFSY